MKNMNVGDRIMNTWVYEGPEEYVMIDSGYPGKPGSEEKRLNGTDLPGGISGMSF